jgi:hypothetical protein
MKYYFPRHIFNFNFQHPETNWQVHAMLPTIARRTAQQGIPYVLTNPYKAKRLWPPDFSKLPPKQQFRLERRYKRRAKLKWARPRWTKAVKLVQMSSIVCAYACQVVWD